MLRVLPVSLLLLAGCASAPAERDMSQAQRVIGSGDLQASAQAEFPFAEVRAFNRSYAAVSAEWVNRIFTPSFTRSLLLSEQYDYRPRGNQCEHFAFRGVLHAVGLFCAEKHRSAESLAAAVIAYKPDDSHGRLHCVMAWYIDGAWQPYEPQAPRRFFKLSATERLSVRNVILL